MDILLHGSRPRPSRIRLPPCGNRTGRICRNESPRCRGKCENVSMPGWAQRPGKFPNRGPGRGPWWGVQRATPLPAGGLAVEKCRRSTRPNADTVSNAPHQPAGISWASGSLHRRYYSGRPLLTTVPHGRCLRRQGSKPLDPRAWHAGLERWESVRQWSRRRGRRAVPSRRSPPRPSPGGGRFPGPRGCSLFDVERRAGRRSPARLQPAHTGDSRVGVEDFDCGVRGGAM